MDVQDLEVVSLTLNIKMPFCIFLFCSWSRGSQWRWILSWSAVSRLSLGVSAAASTGWCWSPCTVLCTENIFSFLHLEMSSALSGGSLVMRGVGESCRNCCNQVTVLGKHQHFDWERSRKGKSPEGLPRKPELQQPTPSRKHTATCSLGSQGCYFWVPWCWLHSC